MNDKCCIDFTKIVRGRSSHGSTSKMHSFRLPPEIVLEAKKNADNDGLTLTSVVKSLLKKYNECKRRKNESP